MLAEMTAAEYRGWHARQAIRGPFAARRLDYAAALICHWIMESQRAKGTPMPFETFLIEWDARAARSHHAPRDAAQRGSRAHTSPKRQRGKPPRDPDRQTSAQQIAIVQSFIASFEAREMQKHQNQKT